MPDYNHLRNLIAKHLKERVSHSSHSGLSATVDDKKADSTSPFVQISAPTLYAALEQAAAKYECAVSDVGYQILSEVHSAGSDSNTVIIRAHKKQQIVSASTRMAGALGAEQNSAADAHIENRDTHATHARPPVSQAGGTHDTPQRLEHPAYSIKKQGGEIAIRIDRTHVQFALLTAEQVQQALRDRTGQNIELNAIRECIENADYAYHTVGRFSRDYEHDATHKIHYTSNNLSAQITLNPPKKNGNEYSAQRILGVLNNEGISYGIDHALLKEIEEYPRYSQPYLVAKGDLPVRGKDAHIVYSEEVRSAMVLSYEQRGLSLPDSRVNYKENNDIVNVLKGTSLFHLVPAQKGKDGKNIFGEVIQANDGKSKEVVVGHNVDLSPDGLQGFATTDGRFRVIDGRFVVDPLYEVQGSVGIKSGNILFLGDVIVRGNVDDGFSVRASGGIEVHGFVGAAQIDSETKVKIHKGVAGKGKAFINSDGDCTVQYIESATVHAAGSVVVGESIVQSEVVAGQEVRCMGKRAAIIGSNVTSGKRVVAKAIGSEGGVQVKVGVGYDPFRLMRLDRLRSRHTALTQQVSHLKRMRRKSDVHFQEGGVEYKISKSERVQAEIAIAENELSVLSDDIDALEEEIHATQVGGEILVTRMLYPNVEISINGIARLVQNNHHASCFSVLNNKIVARNMEPKR